MRIFSRFFLPPTNYDWARVFLRIAYLSIWTVAAAAQADVFWQDLFQPITVIFHVRNGFVVAVALVSEWILVSLFMKIKYLHSRCSWRFLHCCVKCHMLSLVAEIWKIPITHVIFLRISYVVRYRRIEATKKNEINKNGVYGLYEVVPRRASPDQK